jgi:hypothetical protein
MPSTIDRSVVRTVMDETLECARWMVDSAIFITSELPNVQIDDSLRAATTTLCSHLVDAKQNAVNGIHGLDELLRDDPSDERIMWSVRFIVSGLRHAIVRMHELVESLRAAAERDPACSGAYILVAESAVNIMKPFNRASAAADSLTDTSPAGDD